MNALEVRRVQEVIEQPLEPVLPPSPGRPLRWVGCSRRFCGRWRPIGIIAAAVFLVVCVVGLWGKPRYDATALLMVGAQRESVLGAEQLRTQAAPPDSALVDSRTEILKSPKLLGALVDKLNLTRHAEYGGKPGHKLSGEALAQLREDVIAKVGKAINVSRQNLSYVIEVTARSTDPKEAALLANSLVEVYFMAEAEEQGVSSNRANAWLLSRVDELRIELQQKEDAAEAYRSQAGLLSAGGSSLTEQQTAQLQTEVVTARAELADRQARYGQMQAIIRAGGNPDFIVGALQSDVIRDLRARAAEAERKLADANQRYGARHPSVIDAQTELQNVNEQIGIEVGRISRGLKNEVDVASQRLGTLESSLGAYCSELSSQQCGAREAAPDGSATPTRRAPSMKSFLQRYHQISDRGPHACATDMELCLLLAQPARRPSRP